MKPKNLLVLFPLLLIMACATLSVPRTDKSQRYRVDGVSLHPGVVAWSPDSSHLAVTRDEQLVILAYGSGTIKKIPGIRPLFIDWAPGNHPVVVHETKGRNELVRVNPHEGTYDAIPTKKDLNAVKWLHPPDGLITFAHEVKRLAIGTFVTFRLARLNQAGHDAVLEWETYIPTRRGDLEFTSGWTFPGPRPLHETVLTPRYHSPPALSPYVYFKTMDPLILLEEEIIKLETRRFNQPASWSPDGSRLAVTNDEGLLVIVNVENPREPKPVNDAITGRYPAWNPKGSQIYLGGWLMLSDGTPVRKLLDDGVNSMAVWSPDGEKLAVISAGNLIIYDAITPAWIEPDRPVDAEFATVREKLRLLKHLLKEGLLSNSEFQLRRAKLLDPFRGDEK